jgi:hypothetical protein
MEVVTSAFTSDPALLQQALLNPDQPVDLSIASLSLLTPDWVRTGDGNERMMLRDQAQAWNDVSGLQTIRVRNPAGQMVDVTVNVQPLAFNFGVNEGAVVGKFGVNSDNSSIMGWGMANEMNEPGLKALLGDNLAPNAAIGGIIGQAIQRLNQGTPQEQQKALHLATLANQVKTLWSNGAHMRDEGEAYKMVSRLAVMSDMAGVKVAFNCKSGKDRTGNLDTEAKFLASFISVHNAVPPIGHPLTGGEITDLRDLANKGGSRYFQELNTGVEGYKLKGVGSVSARIGGGAHYTQFLGASDATHE